MQYRLERAHRGNPPSATSEPLADDAEMIVAKATGKGFEPLRRYTVAESATWAHPVVLRDGVILKDATTLARWSTN